MSTYSQETCQQFEQPTFHLRCQGRLYANRRLAVCISQRMVIAYLSILRNGRAEERVFFLAVEDLVDKVASFERLELLLVRRPPISVFFYCLISPAILNVPSVH